MKLAISIGVGTGSALPVDLIREVEDFGYDSVWTGESWGADAVTPLAYVAALTTRLKLGSAILQIPGRTPAMTAMTMSTLDVLSGGRALVGLGVSGPQVAEGWHGVPFDQPVTRLREYIQILRLIWAREEPVAFAGKAYQLPYTGPGATGLGKPLKSILHTRNLPIYVASLGPVSIRATAELADGWLPIHFSPYHPELFRPNLEEGFRRAGNGKSWADFDIVAPCTVMIADDPRAGFATMKANLALYVGGMGAREANFYHDLVTRYGYGDAANRIQELYLAGRKAEAEAEVPDDLCDELSLCGPEARIRSRFPIWQDAGVTTMRVHARGPEQGRAALRLMASITGADKGV